MEGQPGRLSLRTVGPEQCLQARGLQRMAACLECGEAGAWGLRVLFFSWWAHICDVSLCLEAWVTGRLPVKDGERDSSL